MEPITSISFIRHGHVHNPVNVYYGRLAYFPLSEEGLHQSQSLAEVLRDTPLACVFSSPLLRARQTAKVILTYHKPLKLRISQLIHEVYTPFDGCLLSKVICRNWDLYTGVSPQYEQPKDIVHRVQKFIGKVRKEYLGQHVVAVTHGDIIAFTILWAKGKSTTPEQKRNMSRLGISYPAVASITTLIYRTQLKDEMPSLVKYLVY